MMDIFSIIKEGIGIANRNWQLILIQFLFMLFGFLGMMIIVGIPLAIAFIIFGLDLTEMLRQPDLMGIFRVAGEMLNKSFPIVIFVVLSFILYAASLVGMSIFVCAGTIGMLARTVQNDISFSMKTFWGEAKRLFFPVFIYANIAGLGFTLFMMLVGVLTEIANQFIMFAETREETLASFIKIFFSLFLGSAGLLIFLAILGITLYGFGYLVFNRPRPFRAVKQITLFILRTPSSFLLMGILFLGFLLFLCIVSFISIFSASIPVIGSILALPLNIFSHAALWYVIFVILSALFIFYYRFGYLPSLPASRQGQDISGQQAPQPGEAPQRTDMN
jgi:hypothetical protein